MIHKKQYGFNLLFFALITGLDQLTKYWAIHNIQIHQNTGFILGSYSDIPQYFRVVSLSSLFGLIFFSYLAMLYLLPRTLGLLKLGISLMVGGIAGNVLDRTLLGASIDFIPLGVFSFNLADVFLWSGAIVVFYKILRHDRKIWFPDNQRTLKLVLPKEQILLAIKFSCIALSSSVLLGLFSFSYLKSIFSHYQDVEESVKLGIFLISFLSISFVFSLIVFFTGLIISNRSAGPFYAFKLYVQRLLKGERRQLKLREDDQYKHLEDVAKDLKDYFEKNDKKAS
jgi:signal peptidase II